MPEYKTVVVESRPTELPRPGTREWQQYVDRYGDPNPDDYEQAKRVEDAVKWLNSEPADRAAKELEEKLTAPIRELQAKLDAFEQAWLRVEWGKVQSRTNLTLLWLIFGCVVYINIVYPLAKSTIKTVTAPVEATKNAIASSKRTLAKVPLVGRMFRSKPSTSSIKISGYWADRAGRGDKFAGGKYTAGSPFGPRVSPGGIGSTYHKGQDVPMPIGTPLYAVGRRGEKVTVTCKESGAGGNTGYISASSMGSHSLAVAHLSRCNPGIYRQGLGWGFSGNTGNSTGPHGHFAHKINGELVPPYRWGIEALLTGKPLENLGGGQ